MAKKTRKVIKQESQQRAIQQAVNNINTSMAVSAAKQAADAPAPSVPARATKSIESNGDEYTYVKRDLRRIGLLAGSFTVILIVLSFFIH